jgi:hypothetical protein
MQKCSGIHQSFLYSTSWQYQPLLVISGGGTGCGNTQSFDSTGRSNFPSACKYKRGKVDHHAINMEAQLQGLPRVVKLDGNVSNS